MKRQRNQSFILIITSLALLVALVGGTWNTAYGAGSVAQNINPAAWWYVPTFNITSVQVDQNVTITTNNFPANDTFNVLMNYIGTRGVGGINVGTVDTGAGGVITWTFNIPASLQGQQRVAIRLESPYTGYFSYNWFWNNSGGIPPTGSTVTPGPWIPPGTIPTFSIQSVSRDTSVTIRTNNFPANDTFNVLMNYIGTRGVGGIQVQTINSGAGGALDLTFNIPAALQGQQRIAIRLESPTSHFFAYNWFWNNTTGGIPPTGPTATPRPGLPPGTIPTFSISSVVRDSTVTVQTSNFLANDDYIVLMNYIGTRGVGGVQVDAFNSGTGGSFSKTFTIPDFLKGQERIAIRIYSPSTGYFAYNWFWNNNAP